MPTIRVMPQPGSVGAQRNQIAKKNEQIQSLRDQVQSLRSQVVSLRQQLITAGGMYQQPWQQSYGSSFASPFQAYPSTSSYAQPWGSALTSSLAGVANMGYGGFPGQFASSWF